MGWEKEKEKEKQYGYCNPSTTAKKNPTLPFQAACPSKRDAVPKLNAPKNEALTVRHTQEVLAGRGAESAAAHAKK